MSRFFATAARITKLTYIIICFARHGGILFFFAPMQSGGRELVMRGLAWGFSLGFIGVVLIIISMTIWDL